MMVGINCLVEELQALGYKNVSIIADRNNVQYALLSKFSIPAGSFAGREVDVAIPAPGEYPRQVPCCIHVRPHLLPFGSTETRNIIQSALGDDWQYWSYRFHLRAKNTTAELMGQINDVFRKN